MKIKEDEVYFVIRDEEPGALGLRGLIYRDTICLDTYEWNFANSQRLSRTLKLATIREYHAVLAEDRSQRIGIKRTLKVDASGFQDELEFFNPTLEQQTLSFSLNARARLIDLFQLRQDQHPGNGVDIQHPSEGETSYQRTGEDGVTYTASIKCPDLDANHDAEITLAPKDVKRMTVRVDVASSDHDPGQFDALPTYEAWREPFRSIIDTHPQRPGLVKAVDDLRSLLLRTEAGPFPAAGLPIFVNLFGRDSLITAMMVSDWQPDMLKSVLAFLAARQGQKTDPFREEEPGKILHEIRRGELSRTNKIPFGRYYGSVDSTPLFIMAAEEYLRVSDDRPFIESLRPTLRAAADWLAKKLDDPSGLANFEASGSGLTVQSWKDSADSMVDEHGHQAKQPIAVAEVQGYCYAALRALPKLLGDSATEHDHTAEKLRDTFHEKFWLGDKKTFAMALDADGKPLRVVSSDPGHLLWSGIVREELAPALAKTMMGESSWSGWGVRTLGAEEVAYNAVSYHNGSVWPHDTAIFGMGLARYGLDEPMSQVANALLDLADKSPNHQLPEVISGFSRGEFEAPVPYTHANAPQAWAAAGLIRMASLLPSGA